MKIKINFVPNDLWIGVFWKRKKMPDVQPKAPGGIELLNLEVKGWWTKTDVYICIVPCFPIHLGFIKYEHVSL